LSDFTDLVACGDRDGVWFSRPTEWGRFEPESGSWQNWFERSND